MGKDGYKDWLFLRHGTLSFIGARYLDFHFHRKEDGYTNCIYLV